MRIVLKREEVQSFEGFLCAYANTCRASLVAMDTEDARELLQEVDGLTNMQMVELMISDVNLEPMVKFLGEDQDEVEFEVNAEILMAYNEYMTSSMKILRPYACKLAKVVVDHEDVLKRTSQKGRSFWVKTAKAIAGPVSKAVLKVAKHLELDTFILDVVNVFNEFKTDEYGLGAMQDEVSRLEQKTFDICSK